MTLAPEQAHDANDLALYAANTSKLYPDAIEIMKMRAVFGIAPTDLFGWARFVRKARSYYRKDVGFRVAHYSATVTIVAARQVRDHYAEQQAEITASYTGETI